MSTPMDRDRILEEILSGDLEMDSAEALELFGRDPEAQQEIEELLALEAELVRHSTQRQEDVNEAGGVSGSPGEERVRDIVADLSCGGSAPAVPLRTWFAAAAAVLLVAFLGWFSGQGSGSRSQPYETTMGAGKVVFDHPVGDVRAFEPFRWSPEGLEVGWYAISVNDGDAPPGSDPLVDVSDLEEPRWESESSIEWPMNIRWKVTVFDESGAPLGTRAVDASR